jgi:hypothetical protein
MIGSSLGAVHFTAAIVALTFGAIVLAAPKGTPLHRTIGHGYVTAMVILNASALAIYRLTGQFEPFHALALFSLATVVHGMMRHCVAGRVGSWPTTGAWPGPISACWPPPAAKSSFGCSCAPGFSPARGSSSAAVSRLRSCSLWWGWSCCRGCDAPQWHISASKGSKMGWGLWQRHPAFAPEWRNALRLLRPSVLVRALPSCGFTLRSDFHTRSAAIGSAAQIADGILRLAGAVIGSVQTFLGPSSGPRRRKIPLGRVELRRAALLHKQFRVGTAEAAFFPATATHGACAPPVWSRPSASPRRPEQKKRSAVRASRAA